MIKYNSNTINDWYYNSSDIIKVYHNGAVCYYKLDSSSPSGQTPCFAVVDDITQYTETEFEDVFDKATEKWYKLNNLNQYEEYGVYGSGRTICSAASFTELTDIIAQSTTALTNHNITVTPAVGAFSKIRIDTTKSATTTSYCWTTFTPTPSGSEVLGINMSSIGAMNGYGNNKNYVTDANGSQTFAHWVDDNNTIVEIDIAALSNNQTSELYLLFYQENCNPAAFSFYIEPTDCVTTYEGKLTIDEEVSPLPYTELEWIEMPQTEPYCAVQLVDTYSAATNLYYDFKLLFNNLSDLRILGFANNSHLIGYHNNTIYLDINGSRKFTSNGFTTNTEYHFGLGYKNNSYVFENIDSSTTYATFNAPLPKSSKPYFGAVTINGTIYVNGESERIYSVKVYDDGVLVGDYIPVKRNSDDFVTLYDLISEQYCNTTGGGTMVAGPTVTPTSTTCEFIYSGDSWVNLGEVSGSSRLPVGYTEVEYIEHLNDVRPNTSVFWTVPNDGVSGNVYTVDLSLDSNQSGVSRYIQLFGSTYGYCYRQDSGYRYNANVGYMTKINYSNSYTPPYDTKLRYRLEPLKLTVTNTVASTSVTINLSANRNMPSGGTDFGVFNANMNDNGAYCLKGKIYSILIEDNNGDIKHNYVPCKRDNDNTVGLYDIIGNAFYNPSVLIVTAGEETVKKIYPIYYEEKLDPPNNLVFSSMTEAESYECPWVGMNATIDGSGYTFTSAYTWEYTASGVPSGYTELEYCIVPRVKPTTLFTVPYECQPNYKYTTEFTPLNFWSTSYYGGIARYNDSNNKDFEYLIFKLDNGWGDQFNRFMIKFQNYEWDTRSSGTVPRAFTFYENVRAKITLHLNNYSAGQGAVLTIENEGYTTYSNTRTQVIDSSWQITYGVKDLNLLNNSTNDFCANMNFHNFKVEDTQGNLIYDYRPVTRLSDNKVGLYDVVKQQFFYPTGFTLTAGPSV